MLHYKNTTILSELQPYFSTTEKAMTTLFTALRSLKLPNKCFASIDKVNTQYACKQIFMILLLLPLFAVQDISHITGFAPWEALPMRKRRVL
ncbi:MAG: hypothetical protein LBL94_02660 [Prevotellaceae bacterium]|jgi:hypothetical protein|nr:hypothetical protein [Prevotellaceae bacterium]